jgi:hypothetical protein
MPTQSSVFTRQTDGLQYARGFVLAVWLSSIIWGLVLAAFWWAGP